MGQPLGAAQLAYLANEYGQLGDTLQQYQAAHGADPDVDLAPLGQLISDIDDVADTLINKAAATEFNDASSAYASLTSITQQANALAASLVQEVNKFSLIAKISTAMISLATALGSGNPVSVFGAIANCAQAMSGH